MNQTLQDLNQQTFFLLVAVLLAFGFYQTIGTGLDTDVPVVSVVSESMEPAFYRGDLIVVKGVPFEEIQEQDIIVYQSDYLPMPIIHRVVEKQQSTLSTQGDNNQDQVKVCVGQGRAYKPLDNQCRQGYSLKNVETGITEDQVLGRATFIVPKLGYAKLYPTCLFMRLTTSPDNPNYQYTCE